jgi:serine protease inhibitor ecotin
MAIGQDDRTAIVELISLHGHLSDDGDLDRLDRLSSVVSDVSSLPDRQQNGRRVVAHVGSARLRRPNIVRTFVTE